jgi:hypothetical protein
VYSKAELELMIPKQKLMKKDIQFLRENGGDYEKL